MAYFKAKLKSISNNIMLCFRSFQDPVLDFVTCCMLTWDVGQKRDCLVCEV
jgi:hypothetical protein